METALEHQARLIDQYQAMEKAQREWEEKFRENSSSTPDHKKFVILKGSSSKLEKKSIGQENFVLSVLYYQILGYWCNIAAISTSFHYNNVEIVESKENANVCNVEL
ncbi:hypothetical protein RIF29_09659 [Crotalaria pallida]|uniref:Uncharacterized protein n=1 Tax=Crotalaria pallida TaxID=3830 RepID=A0AAN9II04_CROPI